MRNGSSESPVRPKVSRLTVAWQEDAVMRVDK